MSSDLPREIRVTELSDGVHYCLPTRRFGRMAVVGLVMVLFGLPFACSGVAGMIAAKMFGDQLSWLLGLAIGLMSVAVLALGVFLVLSGLWMAIGHAELRVTSAGLASMQNIGPWSYVVKRRPLEAVKRLVLVSDGAQQSPVLVAVCAGAAPVEMAALYPYDWLWYIGHDLAWRCADLRKAEALSVEQEWTDFSGERPVQPALSRIVVDQAEDGQVFHVPAVGWRSLGPLLLVFIAIVVPSFVLGIFLQIGRGANVAGVIAIPFLVGAIGALLGAIVLARRRIDLAVRGDTLELTRVGLFTRTRSWSRDEIDAIRTIKEQRKRVSTDQHGHTHTSWIWVVELQIHHTQGNPVPLTGRYGMRGLTDEEEWEWLATALRQALEVPA